MKPDPAHESRRRVHQTGDRLEATLVASALESEGIPVFVSGGENPLAGLLDLVRWAIWVDAEDEERAREVIASLEQSVPDENELAAEALYARPADERTKDRR